MATNFVSLSSNQQILTALKNLSRKQFSKGRLLGPFNAYLVDTISKTDDPAFVTGAAVINVPHIAQYIASSVLVHCLDGWNFISRSSDAIMAGDIATCIHMAYYSELRGAMSIMASEGIGIFNKKHLYFNAANAAVVFRNNNTGGRLTTHSAAKELMDEWASLPNKKQTVFDCIEVNNRKLGDWIGASGHPTMGGYAASLLGEWLKQWSIDLKLDIDQYLRNETSYRPHFSIPPVNISRKIDEFIEIWQNLEPSTNNSYPGLDMHILRLSLEKLFRMISGRTPRHASYITFIDTIFDNLGESKQQELYEFIFRRHEAQDHILLREAKRDSNKSSINFHDPIPLICRAILLLRFATGICKITLSNSDVNFDNLKFWWQDSAFKYGLITENPSELTPVELYADVSDSIRNIQTYTPQAANIKQANASIMSDICNLKQFQRVCYWGMGL